MLSLTRLIENAKLDANITGDASVEITSITADSRQVKDGALFIAMPGVVADGTRYIPEALRKGAAAILMAKTAKSDVLATVPMVRTEDMREAVSSIAAAFYTKQPQYSFAITGTDGKTSSADFVRQLATLLGHNAASIGTLGLRSSHSELNQKFPAVNTSPEPILLHEMLNEFADNGGDVVAIEASSHGLDQKRLDGVNFTAAAFTNFGRDHLDYHPTIEAYFAAKARLFSHVLGEGKTAVLNRDDARFDALKTMCDTRNIRVISFGKHTESTYRLSDVTPHVNGLNATVTIGGKAHAISLPLYGEFQLANMLTAVGLLSAARFDTEKLIGLLPRLQGVPGRLEKIASHNGAAVFIDYAHTPAALEKILLTLRPHTQNKLHVVFGCGGDRDPGKRPEMGAAAVKFADHVIVTDDNPRSENPATIRAAIMQAAIGAEEIADRAKAIAQACNALKTGDVLVVAGKGHETTQLIGDQTLHFVDAEHIRKAAEQ